MSETNDHAETGAAPGDTPPVGHALEPLPAAGARVDEGRTDALESAHRRRRPARYRSIVAHWMSRWFRRPRPAAIAPLPTILSGQVGVTFGGHATVLIRYAGVAIACDPMLGSWIGGVRREVDPGLAPGDLQDVDLVLISHGHRDHLHLPTLAHVSRRATVVVPAHCAARLSRLGFARVVELGVDQSFQHRGVDISTAAVRHGDGAEAGGLAYAIRGDGPSVFFCADSGYFSGFARVGEVHHPDVAILPIGGYAPSSFRDRHMSPLDALHAFEDLQARILVPIHHGSFALSYERLDDPRRWLAQLCREQALEPFVVMMEPGQSRVFVPPRALGRQPPSSGDDDVDTRPGGEPPTDVDLADLDEVSFKNDVVLGKTQLDAVIAPLPELRREGRA